MPSGIWALRIDTSGGGENFGALFLLNMDKLFPKAIIYVLYH